MTSSQNPQMVTMPLQSITPAQEAPTSPRTHTLPLRKSSMPASTPTLTVTKPVRIPNGVASNAKQHVTLALDISGSMAGSKIDELNLAVSGLIQELARPDNKDGFLVSVIEFSTRSRRVVFAEPATSMTFTPAHAGGGTNFDSALLEVIRTVEEFNARPNPDGWRYLRPQVLFLSDGQSAVSDKNIADIQEIADVTTIAYGSDANTKTLSRIASDGQIHVVGTDGSALREFLAEVGKTLSQSLATVR